VRPCLIDTEPPFRVQILRENLRLKSDRLLARIFHKPFVFFAQARFLMEKPAALALLLGFEPTWDPNLDVVDSKGPFFGAPLPPRGLSTSPIGPGSAVPQPLAGTSAMSRR
jgi:hypothetical protein